MHDNMSCGPLRNNASPEEDPGTVRDVRGDDNPQQPGVPRLSVFHSRIGKQRVHQFRYAESGYERETI